MRSSIDGKEHHVADESLSDAWAPWMDDRTTTSYPRHLGFLRARGAGRGPESNPALQFASLRTPPELELSTWQPAAMSGVRLPARSGVQSSVRTLHGVPQQPSPQSALPPTPSARATRPTERTLSDGWHVAAPQAATAGYTLPAPVELAVEDKPFARPSGSLGAWVAGLGAGAGLFGAVLFGHVVLAASTQAPSLRAVPPVIAAPAAPLAAAETIPQPLSASAPPEAAAPLAADNVHGGVDDVSAHARESFARARGTAAHAGGRSDDASAANRFERSRRARSDESDADGVYRSRSSTRARVGDAVLEPSAAASAPRRRARDAEDGEADSAAPAGAPGVLRINSRPWSQVTLDGAPVGHTPLFDLRVSPGTHTLRLVNPEFGLTKTVQLKVAPGENITRVELLEP